MKKASELGGARLFVMDSLTEIIHVLFYHKER